MAAALLQIQQQAHIAVDIDPLAVNGGDLVAG